MPQRQEDHSASDFSRDISGFHKLKISSSLPSDAPPCLCVKPFFPVAPWRRCV